MVPPILKDKTSINMPVSTHLAMKVPGASLPMFVPHVLFTIIQHLHLPAMQACDSSPCLNGATCFNSQDINQYVCICASGFEGTRCEIDIDSCLSGPCLNGATCTDLVSGYECTCPGGFGGANCQIGKCELVM